MGLTLCRPCGQRAGASPVTRRPVKDSVSLGDLEGSSQGQQHLPQVRGCWKQSGGIRPSLGTQTRGGAVSVSAWPDPFQRPWALRASALWGAPWISLYLPAATLSKTVTVTHGPFRKGSPFPLKGVGALCSAESSGKEKADTHPTCVLTPLKPEACHLVAKPDAPRPPVTEPPGWRKALSLVHSLLSGSWLSLTGDGSVYH